MTCSVLRLGVIRRWSNSEGRTDEPAVSGDDKTLRTDGAVRLPRAERETIR